MKLNDLNPNYEFLYKEAKSEEEALRRLIHIVSVLRKECPWDRQQTHESLKQCLLEEAYEVIEAIDRGDLDNLEEELGDVLLQIVFHVELEKASENFDFKSITNRECEKMIRRHPHVFFKENVETIDNAIEKWENVKRQESGECTCTESLEQIPRALPALIRSFKIQKKVAQVGFDWNSVDDAFSKVAEETEEILEVYKSDDKDKIKEEIGDLLFAVVNVARFLDVNPEEALTFTSQKFIDRFRFIEDSAESKGTSLTDMSLAEMDELWEQAKCLERRKS